MSRPIYLDHNATTPLDPEVFEAMKPYFLEKFGNPSSVEHYYGHEAQQAVEEARQTIADVVDAGPEEVIFTGSCTEANNLAILGVARAYPDKDHFIASSVEHPSVLECFRFLEDQGKQVTYLRVDEFCRIDPDDVRRAIRPNTALISVMGANNEVGTLQPIQEIGDICRETDVLFHTDCAQTTGYLPFSVRDTGVHLASLSGHKAYGPKGVGVLYRRARNPRVKLRPLLFGGGQEKGLRPGTINTPLIVGMAKAVDLSHRSLQSNTGQLARLRDRCLELLRDGIPDIKLNGHPTERLPGSLALSVPGISPEALIRLLSDQVAFSASSACSTGKVRTSPVLIAMFGEIPRAREGFRLGLGRSTTDDHCIEAAQLIVQAVQYLRSQLDVASSNRHPSGVRSA